ncbi:hypothetical protein [Pedobacter sp. KBS0701]|nr:hypothetical protein [Pedobacter sp. KBS0701]
MEIPELPDTVPRLVRRMTITGFPAGSTLEKEVANIGSLLLPESQVI